MPSHLEAGAGAGSCQPHGWWEGAGSTLGVGDRARRILEAMLTSSMNSLLMRSTLSLSQKELDRGRTHRAIRGQ